MLNRETALRIAKSRKVISQPGKYLVKVTSQPNLFVTDDIATQGPSRYLVNFNAMTALQAQELRAAFKAADAAGETDYQGVLNGANLTGSINFSGEVAPDWIPAKNELVHIIVDKVQSKRRGTTVLGVVSVTAVPVSQASDNSSFSLDELVEEETPEGATLHAQIVE